MSRSSNVLALGMCSVLVVAVVASPSRAYERYSVDDDATNCRACHGDFRDDNYFSFSDEQNWGNLHDLHRFDMLSGDCDTCHGQSDFPVLLEDSDGGTGLESIGCVGCHGRNEDMGHDSISNGRGAGLRQHHTNSGIDVCATCHSDANPASYTPVGEDVLPSYYFTPDASHPNKPTAPCNSNGEENYAGSAEGLDNDGDGTYDLADSECLFECPGDTAGACCPEADVNGDGQVNGLDIAAISNSANFGLAVADAADPCTDVNFDGQVNGLDVAAASSSACFGRTSVDCANAARGGALYDRFWDVAGVNEPTLDHPLWASRPDQATNTRTGSDTWRCKECHGWDYKGKDGDYGPGNGHHTGFNGIFGTTLTAQEAFDLIKTGHSYGDAGLSDKDVWDLVKFVLEGQIDTTTIINVGGAFTGNTATGQVLYESGIGSNASCMSCHGVDGLAVPPGGDPGFNDYVGLVANANPWEFQHKVRFGQPGSAMPSSVAGGGTTQDVADVGAHSQTLPQAP